jgi:hypothetical protein
MDFIFYVAILGYNSITSDIFITMPTVSFYLHVVWFEREWAPRMKSGPRIWSHRRQEGAL